MTGALRYCTGKPNCPNKVIKGKCKDCVRASDAVRGTSAQRGYNAAWRRVRAGILAAEPRAFRDKWGTIRGQGPLCVFCTINQRVTAATEVDHIDGDSSHNDVLNLRPLCKPCHSSRTLREQVCRS